MTKTKKKILIGSIIGIIVMVGGIIYYYMQNNDEDYFGYEEEQLYENMESNKNIENIENSIVENKAQIKVHISGQIANPGVISLDEGSRIIDAINAAGGVTEEADLSKINLAYILADAQKINIPSINEKENVEYITSGSGQTETAASTNNMKEVTMININTANETELQRIPGIGESIALKIIAYRKENGKFNTIEDIKKVNGIGTSKYNSIKKYICVK